MIKFKYIVVFLVLTSTSCFSQTFSNLDSILTKNYDAVNRRDSIYYISLINGTAIYKNAKSKADTSAILKPFTDAFRDLINELSDMTSSTDFTVKYVSYEFRNKNTTTATKGKLPMHVNLIVNDKFLVNMPFVIFSKNGQYSIESPMTVMFAESKE